MVNGFADPLDPLNWSPNSLPTSSDSLYFDGSVTSADCILDPSQDDFVGVHLVNGYAGHVSVTDVLQVDYMELTSGAIDQPMWFEYVHSIYVWNTFDWTGGTLNSTANLGYVQGERI